MKCVVTKFLGLFLILSSGCGKKEDDSDHAHGESGRDGGTKTITMSARPASKLKVIEVISKGAAQSWQMENRHKTMIDDKFDYGFAVDWMRKDLEIAMEEAKRNNSPLPITKIIDEYYGDVQKMGGNRWDTSSLIKRFRK